MQGQLWAHLLLRGGQGSEICIPHSVVKLPETVEEGLWPPKPHFASQGQGKSERPKALPSPYA